MASRAELIQFGLELQVDLVGLNIGGMTQAVREAIDKNFDKKYPICVDSVTDRLLKYMCT